VSALSTPGGRPRRAMVATVAGSTTPRSEIVIDEQNN
jgi:hypothetical protein